jgi:hypothetical protein
MYTALHLVNGQLSLRLKESWLEAVQSGVRSSELRET